MFDCSFCGKNQTEVLLLIAGPIQGDKPATICDECVSTCEILIAEEKIRVRSKPFMETT